MKSSLIFFVLIIYLIFYDVHISLAAELGIDKKKWDPPSVGPVTTWTAPIVSPGRLDVQPYFIYNRSRGIFDEESHYKSYTGKDTKSQYQEYLFVQLGVLEGLDIAGQGVYQQNQIHMDGSSAQASGFGDSYIFLRYRLIEEDNLVPNIVAMFQLKLPTGKYQKADEGKLGADLMGNISGGGSYEHAYGIILTKRIKPFAFHCDIICNFPIETKVDGIKTKYGAYVNYDGAIEYFFSKGFNLLLEFNGFVQGDSRLDASLVPASDTSYLNMATGIGWSCDVIKTLVAYQRTLAGTNITVDDSIIVTFIYSF